MGPRSVWQGGLCVQSGRRCDSLCVERDLESGGGFLENEGRVARRFPAGAACGRCHSPGVR